MKIIVKTNFPFNVQNIGFSSHGELVINLSSNNENPKNRCRQLLKIPRSMKYYHTIKELLRALTSSMLLSLEIANTKALLFTRLIATFAFFLPKSFYFFWGRIARYDGANIS